MNTDLPITQLKIIRHTYNLMWFVFEGEVLF